MFCRRHCCTKYIYGCTCSVSPIHTCEKHAHSCYRNIVSFANLPGAREFKSIGRAIRHLISSILHTWCITSLATVSHEVNASFQILRKFGASSTCLCCKCKLPGPTITTCDAGQAYEVLRPEQVLADLDHVLRRAEDAKCHLIQVYKTVKSIVGFTKSLHRSKDDRVVVTARTIRRCVSSYMKLRIFRFCNIFLQQISGVPIGGWLSSSLLNLCASTCESKLEARWPDLCKKYNLDLPREQLFFAKRYEDDVLGISLKLCKKNVFTQSLCTHTSQTLLWMKAMNILCMKTITQQISFLTQ